MSAPARPSRPASVSRTSRLARLARRRPFVFEPAPELPGSDNVNRVFYATVPRLLDALWDFNIEGVENIPLDRPAVISPNHLSFCDSVFVPGALPRRMWAVGKGEYMDSWKTKHLLPALGMIPIDRGGGSKSQAALDAAARVLQGGYLFMIYPEGTRSRSGNLHKGKTGAARLAIANDAPIIPVGVVGTLDIQPPDQFMMKPFKPCTVRFGAPLEAGALGDLDDPRLPRKMTDRLMYEISQLSGQKYVNTYASKTDTPGDPLAPDRADVTTVPGAPAESRPAIMVPAGRAAARTGGPIRRPPGRTAVDTPVLDLTESESVERTV